MVVRDGGDVVMIALGLEGGSAIGGFGGVEGHEASDGDGGG